MVQARNLLFILGELTHSGVEKMLEASAGLWQQAGYQPHILAVSERVGDFAPSLQACGYVVHHLRFSRSPGFIAAVLRFHRAHRFDVVHIQTEQAAFWHALMARLVQRDVRLVRSVHAVFNFAGLLRLRRLLQRWFMRTILQVQFTAPGLSVADHEAAIFKNPMPVLPNWLGRERPFSADWRSAARTGIGLAADSYVFASVGNCAEVKNHRLLLQAAALLPRDRPWVYLHVGASEEEADEKAYAAELGIADRCLFVGRRPAADMMAAADLFAMPSRREGFGLAAAEALAMGLHCVLSDVAGLRDFAAFDAAISWCAPDKPASIAAAIVSHMETMPRHPDIALRVRRQFAVEVGSQRFLSLYAAKTQLQA